MATLIVGPGTDIKKLKKRLKERGFVLRVYHKSDGRAEYRIYCNSYQPISQESLMDLLKGLLE